MTDRDPEPPRTLLSMQALRWRALAEIRQQPGCSGVLDIAINHVTDQRAGFAGEQIPGLDFNETWAPSIGKRPPTVAAFVVFLDRIED
jgi:hypothetical protein